MSSSFSRIFPMVHFGSCGLLACADNAAASVDTSGSDQFRDWGSGRAGQRYRTYPDARSVSVVAAVVAARVVSPEPALNSRQTTGDGLMELARFERAIRRLLHQTSRPAAPRENPTSPIRRVGSKSQQADFTCLTESLNHTHVVCQPELTSACRSFSPIFSARYLNIDGDHSAPHA